MARTSPGVQRIVSVINFFAEHPGQAFTLTDLVRALRLSRATCHALLAGLVDAGYLYRTNDKSYILGPTLAAIGRIANDNFSPLQVAHSEIRELADEFSAICSVYFVEGDEVVTRARAAALSQLGWPSSLGVRMKLRIPFAAIFAAWMPQSEADTWVDTFSPPPSPEQRESMYQGMSFARQHGYSFGIRSFGRSDSREAVKKALHEGYIDLPVSLASELEHDHLYPLAFIMSPVFDSANHVAFTLGLVGFDSHISGAEIERMGTHLHDACKRITDFILGRQPAGLLAHGEDIRISETVE